VLLHLQHHLVICRFICSNIWSSAALSSASSCRVLLHLQHFQHHLVKCYFIFSIIFSRIASSSYFIIILQCCSRRRPRESPVVPPESFPLLKELTVSEHKEGALALTFVQPACTSSRLVGGKGCQLAMLTQLHTEVCGRKK